MAQTLTGSEVTASSIDYVLTTTVAEGASTDTLKIKLGGLSTPAARNVANCTTVTGDKKVVTTASFNAVRIGDAVTGTGIAASSKVATKQGDTELQLNNAVTTGGTGTLTFTPAAPTGEILILTIDKSLSPSGGGGNDTLVLNVGAYYAPGDGKADSPTPADLLPAGSLAINLNLKDYKGKQRQ